jgi:hypothetical protein
MAAGKYNFVIEQGSTLVKDKIGGSTTHITLSSSLSPDGTGLNFSGSSGINPPTSGTIGVFISANSSSALDFSKAVYDLEIVSGSDFPIVTRLLQGTVTLDKEVTTAP